MRKPGDPGVLELADRIGDQYVLERLNLHHPEVIVVEDEVRFWGHVPRLPDAALMGDLAPPAPTENWFLPEPEDQKTAYRQYLSNLPGNRKRNKRRNRRR